MFIWEGLFTDEQDYQATINKGERKTKFERNNQPDLGVKQNVTFLFE